jgi:hypothetical protein
MAGNTEARPRNATEWRALGSLMPLVCDASWVNLLRNNKRVFRCRLLCLRQSAQLRHSLSFDRPGRNGAEFGALRPYV